MAETYKEIFKGSNDQKIVQKVESMFDNTLDYPRQVMERIWWRNILYYIGEQWIEFVRSQQTFRRKSTPYYIPTPVSNEIREYVRTMKALLLSQKLTPRIWPNTQEREDMEGANAGEKLLIALDSKDDGSIHDEKERMLIWMILSGTSFIRTFPCMSEGKVYFIDNEPKSTGDVVREAVIPFNVKVSFGGDTLQKKRWVGIESFKEREWVEDTYKVVLPKSNAVTKSTDFQRRLMKLVGAVSPWKGQGIDTTIVGDLEEDFVLFREVEFRPSIHDKEGRYVVTCEDKKLINVPRLPIKSDLNIWNYTLTDFHFNYVPGRFWSDSGVNDLISPQNTINEIDQLLAINRKGIGRPRLMTPGDVGLKRINEGGQGFLAISYNPLLSGGKEPRIEPGTPLPPQVLEERAIQKIQMQDTAGDPKNILRGQPPSAQSSGIQIDILREVAERGHAPDIERFNRSLNKVYKKGLLVAQEIMTEERIIKYIGRGEKVATMKFKAADLKGNTDVRLEVDSSLLTTKSGQTDVMMKMISAGFFGEPTPSLREEILTRMGFAGFTDEINNDVERAEAENTAVMSGEMPLFLADVDPETGEQTVVADDPKFKYDDHAVHYDVHRKFIVSPEFDEMPLRAQTVLIHHADIHHQLMQASQQAQGQEATLREFVQIDKLYPFLARGEQKQVLQSIGIQPDDKATEAGLPSADALASKRMENKIKIAELVQKDAEAKRSEKAGGQSNARKSAKD